MNESKVKTVGTKQIKEDGGYAHRIEDRYSVGFPDMIVKFVDTPVMFVEVKMIRAGYFAPEPRQLIELLRLRDAGAVALVAGFNEESGRWYISPPRDKILLSSCWSMTGTLSAALREYVKQCLKINKK